MCDGSLLTSAHVSDKAALLLCVSAWSRQTDRFPSSCCSHESVCVWGGCARLSGSCFDQRLHHEYSWYTYSQQPAAGHIYRHTHTLNDGNNGYKSSPEPPPSRSYFEFTFKAPLLQSERARQGVTSTCWNPHINVLLGSVFCYLKSLNFVGFFPGFVCQATHRCSTLWLVKITLRPTLHHHHVNMVLFPFVVVHIPLCCWR